jgi:hypothetical protein
MITLDHSGLPTEYLDRCFLAFDQTSVAWWVKGEDEEEVAVKLAEAAALSLDWASGNGIAFDPGKTEEALFRMQKVAPTATIRVGANDIAINTEATRWLRVWLDSQLTLKDHHGTKMKEGKKAM